MYLSFLSLAPPNVKCSFSLYTTLVREFAFTYGFVELSYSNTSGINSANDVINSRKWIGGLPWLQECSFLWWKRKSHPSHTFSTETLRKSDLGFSSCDANQVTQANVKMFRSADVKI